MKRIDDEFAFQVRELADQITGILGDPPNQKNYDMMVRALLAEYTKETIVEDVNLLSFALVDHLSFDKPGRLLTAAKKYHSPHPAEVSAMVSCASTDYTALLARLFESHPELTRQAVIVAFLHKNPDLWLAQEGAPEIDEEDDEDELDEDEGPTEHLADMFDEAQDPHEH
ncbi:MAG: hypothetical protein HKM00_08950 [Gallionella sp.]|nr:hypothetical protein [Gallionella sp.]